MKIEIEKFNRPGERVTTNVAKVFVDGKHTGYYRRPVGGERTGQLLNLRRQTVDLPRSKDEAIRAVAAAYERGDLNTDPVTAARLSWQAKERRMAPEIQRLLNRASDMQAQLVAAGTSYGAALGYRVKPHPDRDDWVSFTPQTDESGHWTNMPIQDAVKYMAGDPQIND